MHRGSYGLVISLLVCACVDGPPPLPDVTRTDSAGVELVRISGASASDPPIADFRELLRIGSVDGPDETQFFRISAVAIHRDGRVVVLDRGNGVVRVFDHAGRLLGSFGRRGEGPGEFSAPYLVAVHGDTALVLDRFAHAFLLDGTHLWSVQPQLPVGAFLWGLASTGDRWLGDVRASAMGGRVRSQEYPSTLFTTRLSADLVPTDTVVTMPGPIQYAVGEAGWALRPLFDPEPKLIPFPGGVIRTRGDANEIELLSQDGQLLRRSTIDVVRAPVTQDLISEYLVAEGERLASRAQNLESSDLRKARLELRLDLPTPSLRPIVGRLLVSESGSLLVERLDLDDAPFAEPDDIVWDLLDPTGELAYRIRSPASVRPMLLRGDTVWAAARDELDIEYVVKYVLESQPSPTA